jgi:hypothetical protein
MLEHLPSCPGKQISPVSPLNCIPTLPHLTNLIYAGWIPLNNTSYSPVNPPTLPAPFQKLKPLLSSQDFYNTFSIKTRCLIHNAHLGKITSFFNFLDKKITHFKKIWLLFLLNICYCNSGLAFKSKSYYIAEQNFMYFITENSQKLRQKRKWALWMRHLLQ